MELTIEQALQQGVAAHKEGKLQEAERCYRAILQSQPLHPDANHNLGVLAVSANKTVAALPLFKAALETNPKTQQFWLSYIDALIKEKQFEAAKQVIQQAKQQGVDGEKLNALKAQLVPIFETENTNSSNPTQQQLNSVLEHYQTGRYGDAEKLAISLTQQFPEHQFGWKVLGALFRQTGRKFEALNANQKAVALSPQDTEAHNNLGNTLKELGRLEESEASYTQAIALKPDYAEAHNNLGITLQELGRLEEAEASYTQAVTLKPDYADAHYNLGVTLQELGRLEEAEASYTQAIAMKPDYAQAYSNLGNTLRQLGRLEEAEASYTQAIAMKPDYAQAYSNLGATLQTLGRLDEAEASYTEAIALKPDYAEAHNNLGATLQALGRLEEAEVSYTQAIALKPDNAKAHSDLGSTLQKLDRLDEAEASYKQAIAMKPDYAVAHSNLGNTLQKLGRLEEAEASYRKAILLKPDLAGTHSNLGNTLKELGRLEEAEASYTQAIALKPDSGFFQNRWFLLFEKGNFEAALKDSESCNTKASRQHSLETLYALGFNEEVYQRIEIESKENDENIRTAAFASFLAKIEKKDTANNFCNNPIDFIHCNNISSHLSNSTEFIAGVIEELYNFKTIWEPAQKSSRKGFQTPDGTNLFENPLGKMAKIKSIILDELDSYYLKFRNESCSYIQKWPSKKNIWGWHVILKHQGYQAAHIHSSGWLSGVIYLKVVPSLGKDEGAIEFSLNGTYYSNVNSPKFTYQPNEGDIVFFPSSLHHKTIPFTTDTDRIIISFDLMPERLDKLI